MKKYLCLASYLLIFLCGQMSVAEVMAQGEFEKSKQQPIVRGLAKSLYLSGKFSLLLAFNDRLHTYQIKVMDHGRTVGKVIYQDKKGFFISLPTDTLNKILDIKVCYLLNSKPMCLENDIYIDPKTLTHEVGNYFVSLSIATTKRYLRKKQRYTSLIAAKLKKLQYIQPKSSTQFVGVQNTVLVNPIPETAALNFITGLTYSYIGICETLPIPRKFCVPGEVNSIDTLFSYLDKLEGQLIQVTKNVAHVEELIIKLGDQINTRENNKAYNFIVGSYAGYLNWLRLEDNKLIIEYLFKFFDPTEAEADLSTQLVGLFDVSANRNSLFYPNADNLRPYFQSVANAYYEKIGLSFRYGGSNNPDYYVITPELQLINLGLFKRILEGLSYWADLMHVAINLYKAITHSIVMPPDTKQKAELAMANALSLLKVHKACLKADTEDKQCIALVDERYNQIAAVVKAVYLEYAGVPGHFTIRNSHTGKIEHLIPYLLTKEYTRDEFIKQHKESADQQAIDTNWINPTLSEKFDKQAPHINFALLTTGMNSVIKRVCAQGINYALMFTQPTTKQIIMKKLYTAFTAKSTTNTLSLANKMIEAGGFIYAGQVAPFMPINNSIADIILFKQYTIRYWPQKSDPISVFNRMKIYINYKDTTKPTYGYWTIYRDKKLASHQEVLDNADLQLIRWSGDAFDTDLFYQYLWDGHLWENEQVAYGRTFTTFESRIRTVRSSQQPYDKTLTAFLSELGCEFNFGQHDRQGNQALNCMQTIKLSSLLVTQAVSLEQLEKILFSQPAKD